MSLLHFILNLAALLLWLNFRAMGFGPAGVAATTSLARTLKPIGFDRGRRWWSLGGLLVLLFVRALLYWQIGSALNWIPHLDLTVVAPPFQSDFLGRMLLFSVLSFGLFLGKFYCWLLLLSAVNRPLAESDPLQRLASQHLGRADRLPAVLKLLAPFLAGALLWLALRPLLTKLALVPPPVSGAHLWQQAVVIGLTGILAWKWLLAALLALHLLTSYVYLGHAPLWNFVTATAPRLLAPLRPLPLRLGRVDLAPALGLALILFAGESGARGLGRLYRELPLPRAASVPASVPAANSSRPAR